MFRRLVWITALVVFAGLAAYFVTRRLMPPVPVAPTAEAKLAWLGREFSLDAAQLARIDALQTAYAPVCEAHCAAIMEAQDTLAASGEDAARRAAAEAELARLKKVCADATRAHKSLRRRHPRPPRRRGRRHAARPGLAFPRAHGTTRGPHRPSRRSPFAVRRPMSPPVAPELAPAPDDEALMLDLMRGDGTALDQLMHRWQRPLRAFLHRHLQNEADACDLAQET
nr:hypothetical protein [Opitutaceae bacterium]